MSQVQVWDFRANADYYTQEELTGFLHKIAKKFTFQEEKGESTDYRHWQGRFSLWKIKRKCELMKLIEGMAMKMPNYLQPTCNAAHKKEAFYCLKEDTRLSGPFTDQDRAAYVPRQYRNIELYPYQKQIIESRNTFDFRVVDCVIDFEGNNGKSTVASIGDLMYQGIDLPPVNDGEKIVQSLCDILIAKNCRQPGIVFIDMPKCLGKEKLGGVYTAIEQIKKGKVWDQRNHYKEWWFDSPRTWVFTNAWPNLNYLSEDRWRFWKIDEHRNLVPIVDPRSEEWSAEFSAD